MKCVILQPSYIPWRGYFHQIQKADVFVFYDDVQYDKGGWRNRNRVKGQHGSQWLSVPIHCNLGVSINQVPICWDSDWAKKHWRSIESAYCRAPYFQEFAPTVKAFYAQRPTMLADFTIATTMELAQLLGINATQYVRSSDLGASGQKTDRLLSILTKLGVTHYISGPAAKDYIEEDKFNAAGISIEYMSYAYPEYAQLWGPYDPKLSIIDLIFMTGPAASNYIWDRAQS